MNSNMNVNGVSSWAKIAKDALVANKEPVIEVSKPVIVEKLVESEEYPSLSSIVKPKGKNIKNSRKQKQQPLYDEPTIIVNETTISVVNMNEEITPIDTQFDTPIDTQFDTPIDTQFDTPIDRPIDRPIDNQSSVVKLQLTKEELLSKLLEIDESIKKVCVDKASIVFHAMYNAYSVLKPKEAQEFALEIYHKTYNIFYEKMSRKFKTIDIASVNISDILNFELSTDDNIQERTNEIIQTELDMFVDLHTSDITTHAVVKNDPIQNVKDDHIHNVKDDLIPVAKNDNVHNVKDDQISEDISDDNFYDNLDEITDLKWIEIKKKHDSNKPSYTEINRVDKQQQLRTFARNFAKTLIVKRDMENININASSNPLLYEMIVDCTGKTLGFINERAIYPNKFLDATFIDDSGIQSASHLLFKREFFEVLKEYLGQDHQVHVRFDKTYEDPMVFSIKFFKKRMQYSNQYKQMRR
jgi:hypothetical protein